MKNSNQDRPDGNRQANPVDSLGPNTEIGRKLRQYYDDVVSEGVPDRFAQLLAELENAEQAPKKD